MKSSGLSENLIKSGVCAVHKLIVEALERLLLFKFEESEYSKKDHHYIQILWICSKV